MVKIELFSIYDFDFTGGNQSDSTQYPSGIGFCTQSTPLTPTPSPSETLSHP